MGECYLLELPGKWLLGIDTVFFDSTSTFSGIKGIPNGIHIVHWGVDSSSLRYARMLNGKETVILRYNHETELVEDVTGDPKFRELAAAVPSGQLLDFVHTDNWDTLSCHLPLLPVSMFSTDMPFEWTPVPKKTWPEDVAGRERTMFAIDKSWFLGIADVPRFEAEMQLAFLSFLLVGDPFSALQWLELVRLMLSARNRLRTHPEWVINVIRLVRVQIETLPGDYALEYADTIQQAVALFDRTVNGVELPLEPIIEVSSRVQVEAFSLLDLLRNKGLDLGCSRSESDGLDEQF